MADNGISEVKRNLDAFYHKTQERAALACAEIAIVLENYAKTHHDWKPQTGATDVSTLGTWEQVGEDLFRVILSAGMDYDVFLELARNGKYAWLWPAVMENTALIREIWQKRLSVI